MLFSDRHDAGRLLATELNHYKRAQNALVLGLARGGLIVAYEVALALSLPLNVIAPRKIGAPNNPELAMGSILDNGEGYFNDGLIRRLGVTAGYLLTEIEKEKALSQRRLALYRQFAPLPRVNGKDIILVDDGMATGSTMLASIQAMRKAGALHIIVAVPVASLDAMESVSQIADEVVCPYPREDFTGVGMFYANFAQTEDQEVIAFLKEANERKLS